MNSTSFISIKKTDLIELCNKCIAGIKKRRKEEETNYTLQEIERRDWWLRRLLGKKKMTFEEMKAQIEHEIANPECFDDVYLHLYDYPSIYGWASLETAEKLLKACNLVEENDSISVSVEDLDYIV